MLVSAPEQDPIDEAIYFWRRLREAKLPFGGVIVNKVHVDYLEATDAEGLPPSDSAEFDELVARDLEQSLNGTRDAATLANKISENFGRYRSLAERDRRNIARLTGKLAARRVIEVPFLDQDVHDLAGLAAVNRYLFADEEERRRMLEEVSVSGV